MLLSTCVPSPPGKRKSVRRGPLRRILIVAPHFAPVNAPDQHRARTALSHLGEFGWNAEVLAVAPEYVDAPVDHDLASALPKGTQIHRTRAIPYQLTRIFGWSSLARRAYGNLRRSGDRLLSTKRFDLVFFSTSQFGVFPLGPYWQQRWGVPFVLDLQDEWVSDYYYYRPEVRPPGGRWKYALAQNHARRQEARVVPQAAQIVSVSAHYNARLRQRFPRLGSARLNHLPFGAAESDGALLQTQCFPHHFFEPGRGSNWVYVGRGGPAMRRSALAFLTALRRALDHDACDPHLRVHFIGTDYATGPRARETFLPIAQELGVADHVREQTARVPHFVALQILQDADAIVIPGSDDPGYSASKLLPCLMAGRPLLGIFHEASSCVETMRKTGVGTVVTFRAADSRQELAERIYQDWFIARGSESVTTPPPAKFAPYTARAMTQRLARIFDAACLPSLST